MRRAGDRLLLRTAVGAGPWTLGLAAGALVGAAGETVLPAVLGRTLDAALDGRGGPFAVWGAASWPAGCAALVAVSVAGAAPAAAIASIAAAIPALGAPVALALIDPWLALVFVAGLPALALALR